MYNSPSYKDILGQPESLTRTDSFEEIHPDDRDKIKNIFEETVRTSIGRVLAPGVALLQKPFTPDTLARKVRAVLDDGKPQTPGTE